MRLSRNGGKIFWGVLLILAAAYMVMSKLFRLPEISIFTLGLTVFLGWMIWKGICRVNFWQILFPIAFLCILYDKPLGITELTPFTVLGAAFLGSIGLSMIFKPNHSYRISMEGHIDGETTSEQYTGEKVRFENNFGESIRYINSDNFQKGHFKNSFGSMSVYLDNAIIQTGEAMAFVECNFGEVQLFIPKEWMVMNYLTHSFGEIKEIGTCEATSNCTLTLKGDVNFGSIEIHYI